MDIIMNGGNKTGKLSPAACMLAVVIIALVSFASLCIDSGSKEELVLPADRCVFVDHHVHVDGVLLEGESRGLMIDFPTYSFDPEGRKLTGLINFEVNDSLLAVYGDGTSLSGAMGGGAATMLHGAYALPYSWYGLTISSVKADGTVTIEYKNETILLSPGEEWTLTASEIQALDGYDGNRSLINVTTGDRIVNYGLLNKNDIVKNR
jgi:hypothetical protein